MTYEDVTYTEGLVSRYNEGLERDRFLGDSVDPEGQIAFADKFRATLASFDRLVEGRRSIISTPLAGGHEDFQAIDMGMHIVGGSSQMVVAQPRRTYRNRLGSPLPKILTELSLQFDLTPHGFSLETYRDAGDINAPSLGSVSLDYIPGLEADIQRSRISGYQYRRLLSFAVVLDEVIDAAGLLETEAVFSE